MIIAIACITEKGAIGRNNELLFHIKEDMERFVKATTDQFVVMGRKTWESLPKKPLANRINIVMTSDAASWNDKNMSIHAMAVSDIDTILSTAKSTLRDVYIIGL